MNNTLDIRLPAIPKAMSPEVHQYYLELHRSLKKIETYLNTLNASLYKLSLV